MADESVTPQPWEPDRRCIAVWVTVNARFGDPSWVAVESMSNLAPPIVLAALIEASEMMEEAIGSFTADASVDDE